MMRAIGSFVSLGIESDRSYIRRIANKSARRAHRTVCNQRLFASRILEVSYNRRRPVPPSKTDTKQHT
jgi:hypothetical protein